MYYLALGFPVNKDISPQIIATVPPARIQEAVAWQFISAFMQTPIPSTEEKVITRSITPKAIKVQGILDFVRKDSIPAIMSTIDNAKAA